MSTWAMFRNRTSDRLTLCFAIALCKQQIFQPKAGTGGALAKWLERRTPDRETRVRSSAGSVCCFLEQETFTPQKSTGNTHE